MAFSQAQNHKPANALFLSPNATHFYWQDRVHTELLIKTRFNRAQAAQFRGSATPTSSRRTYDLPRLRHGRLWLQRQAIFDKDLPSQLVRSSSSPRKPTRLTDRGLPSHQTLRLPRHCNGGQIPAPPSEDRTAFLHLFGARCTWKPNQLPIDATFAEFTMADKAH
jgi:hypothetical protein